MHDATVRFCIEIADYLESPVELRQVFAAISPTIIRDRTTFTCSLRIGQNAAMDFFILLGITMQTILGGSS